MSSDRLPTASVGRGHLCSARKLASRISGATQCLLQVSPASRRSRNTRGRRRCHDSRRTTSSAGCFTRRGATRRPSNWASIATFTVTRNASPVGPNRPGDFPSCGLIETEGEWTHLGFRLALVPEDRATQASDCSCSMAAHNHRWQSARRSHCHARLPASVGPETLRQLTLNDCSTYTMDCTGTGQRLIRTPSEWRLIGERCSGSSHPCRR